MFLKKNHIIAVIPARYHSTRFPCKMLAVAQEKSLLQHTYENAVKTDVFSNVIIATDHDEIKKHAETFCSDVYLTSPTCMNGTERIAELLEHLSLENDQIIFNIQGDHPDICKKTFIAIYQKMIEDPSANMATAVVPIDNDNDILSPHVVKCVFDRFYNALYFSRYPIPFHKNNSLKYPCYQHVGIYAFRKDFLSLYRELKPTPLCLSEDLEQLKVLEHGYKIKIAVVDQVPIGIDTPEDFKKFEKILCQ